MKLSRKLSFERLPTSFDGLIKLHAPRPIHDEVGYNYRLTNIAAALGLAQLQRLDEFIAAKHRIAARYDAAFAELPCAEVLSPVLTDALAARTWKEREQHLDPGLRDPQLLQQLGEVAVPPFEGGLAAAAVRRGHRRYLRLAGPLPRRVGRRSGVLPALS